jgi:hypothetical protein
MDDSWTGGTAWGMQGEKRVFLTMKVDEQRERQNDAVCKAQASLSE